MAASFLVKIEHSDPNESTILGEDSVNRYEIGTETTEKYDDCENVEVERRTAAWSNEAVYHLIEEIRMRKSDLEDNLIRKKTVFSQISSHLKELGFNFDHGEVAKKWYNIVQTYKTVKERISKSGQSRVTWLFYDKMDELMIKNCSYEPFTPAASQGISSSIATHSNVSSHYVAPPTPVSLPEEPAAKKRRVDKNYTPLNLEERLKVLDQHRQSIIEWEREKLERIERMHKEKMELLRELLLHK